MTETSHDPAPRVYLEHRAARRPRPTPRGIEYRTRCHPVYVCPVCGQTSWTRARKCTGPTTDPRPTT